MILDLYQESRVDVRTEIAIWEILLAMAGVALGLYFYGHNTLAVLGVKICKITPSRGVAIEFSSSTVTLVASRLGFPISTTYCQVGSTAGVGYVSGLSMVNTSLLRQIVLCWIVTLFLPGLIAAAMFSYGHYAP
eukprot:TRINITY_DN2207_c0_g1_i3.p1 TRINITY_DN2207_c0_g1~~TRINITY_DN2207_c0_g1_i3.p1  ORF type:complete len:134 (+),score=21.32 TRINITY_DN2207_c0_g1_i3:151-552(+)